MRSCARGALPLVLLLGCLAVATPSAADATAFFGAATAPQTRPTLGAAIGGGLLVVGWEIEYARATEDEGDFAPAVTTFMGNVLAQNPVPLNGMTFYATVGAGVYREALGEESSVNVGTNLGGGVKIDISGPLRLRLDYRLFTFAGEPLHKTPQRFYAGLTISF